ncbi:MAG: SWIM zinc finger domain-containing protein, partial [Myxococcaceae bacterium]
MPTAIAQHLTPELIRRKASASAFSRGEEYSLDGRVQDLRQEDTVIRATVQGSDSYNVELQLVDGKLVSYCSCPMGVQGVFCKHCVATAFTAIGPPADAVPAPGGDRFEKDTELDSFLASNNLQHVRMLGGEVLLDFLPERERQAVRYVLSRQRLSDVATVQSVRRYGYALAYAPRLRDRLPYSAWQFVHHELELAERAKAEVSKRLSLPGDVSTHDIFKALIALRERHPAAISQRPEEV